MLCAARGGVLTVSCEYQMRDVLYLLHFHHVLLVSIKQHWCCYSNMMIMLIMIILMMRCRLSTLYPHTNSSSSSSSTTMLTHRTEHILQSPFCRNHSRPIPQSPWPFLTIYYYIYNAFTYRSSHTNSRALSINGVYVKL